MPVLFFPFSLLGWSLGSVLFYVGVDPNSKKDRPQQQKGPTPIQKGTDPNTKRDRPQHKKGPTPTNTPKHEKVPPNLQQHYSLLSIKFIILLFNFICIIYSELIDEVKIRITNPIIKSVENILILYPI